MGSTLRTTAKAIRAADFRAFETANFFGRLGFDVRNFDGLSAIVESNECQISAGGMETFTYDWVFGVHAHADLHVTETTLA